MQRAELEQISTYWVGSDGEEGKKGLNVTLKTKTAIKKQNKTLIAFI